MYQMKHRKRGQQHEGLHKVYEMGGCIHDRQKDTGRPEKQS